MAKTYLRTGRISWSPLTTAQQAMLANVNGIAIGSTFSATLDSPTETFLIGNGVISVPTSAVVASSGDTAGDVPVDNGDGTYSWTTPSGGSGSPLVRRFPFAFDTPGLLTGHTVYTPTAGDVLLDAWFEVVLGWDGTTPQADFGHFSNNAGRGMFSLTFRGAVTVAFDDDQAFQDSSLLLGNSLSSLRDVATFDQIINVLKAPPVDSTPQGATGFVLYDGSPTDPSVNANTNGDRILPSKFTGDSIKVCVSQDGRTTGADPGSTQGSAVLYLVTATPV